MYEGCSYWNLMPAAARRPCLAKCQSLSKFDLRTFSNSRHRLAHVPVFHVHVEWTVHEFPFLHVLVSCFISSLGFAAASTLPLMCESLKLLHGFCVTWAWRVAVTHFIFALYQAERGRVPAASRGGTVHSPPSPFTPLLKRLKLRRTGDLRWQLLAIFMTPSESENVSDLDTLEESGAKKRFFLQRANRCCWQSAAPLGFYPENNENSRY